MDYTVQEVLQFVEENDVKFVRLAFCDLFGNLKNIAIMKDELPRAFASGISFDASAIRGFMNVEESDLFLFPDSRTLSVLPWRPQQGRVVRLFCDIRHPDGQPFEGDGRHILKRSIQTLRDKGFDVKIGPECEFYLFELDADGEPTKIPQDKAGYFDVAPKDKGENVRREICLYMEEMGLRPERSHHEQGPGQNEIDFRFNNPLTAADHTIVFKSIVRTVAAQNGLYATFMPKPLANRSGNGFHINMSLHRDGVNLFESSDEGHGELARRFIAGVLRHVKECSLILNPLTNSYARFGAFEAPKYITWSRQNRSPLIRIPAESGQYARFELRSPDPCCNPYLAFALLIEAGLDGIDEGISLESPTDADLYRADPALLRDLDQLPRTLGEAIDLAANSAFLKAVLTPRVLERFTRAKSEEWRAFCAEKDRESFEHQHYFLNS
jgi:glutamine synthetase